MGPEPTARSVTGLGFEPKTLSVGLQATEEWRDS